MTSDNRTYTKRRRKPRTADPLMLSSSCTILLAILSVNVTAYTPQARWGQANTVISNTLYVHGGKIDPTNTFGYSTAPNSNDLISLDLSASFPLSTPPWQFLSGSENTTTSQGPALSFHTITAYNSTSILTFGGQDTQLSINTNPDSAWLLDVTTSTAPVWTSEVQGWANEPVRRIYHSASAAEGKVYITGGEKADGSGYFDESYVFDPSAPSFSLVPNNPAAQFPPDVFGHVTITLPSGQILLFGGFSPTENELIPFSRMWVMDSTSSNPQWDNVTATGALPAPRRGFAAAVLDGGKILIQGGADAYLQTVFADGAILDFASMVWSAAPNIDATGGAGARYAHFAFGFGSQVMFGFGYSSNGPASAELTIYDSSTGSYIASYTPPPTTTANPPPPTNPTQSSLGISASNIMSQTGASRSQTWPSLSSPSNTSSGTTPQSNISKPATTSIVVGSLFGALALVALTITAVYYARKRNEHGVMARPWGKGEESGRSLVWAAGDDDGAHDGLEPDSASTARGENVHMIGRWGPATGGLAGVLAAIGLGKTMGRRQRFDMLADEDIREFNISRDLSGHSYESGMHDGAQRPPHSRRASGLSFTSTIGQSIKTIGNVFTRQNSIKEWWDRKARTTEVNPFADEAALLDAGEFGTTVRAVAARPRGGEHHFQSSSDAYRDPFASELDSGPGSPTMEEGNPFVNPLAGSSTGPGTHAYELGDNPGTIVMAPLSKVVSAGAGSTSSSNEAGSGSNTTARLSTSSHELSSPSSGAAPTLMSNTRTAPVRRSDSWWARFSRTSLLLGDRTSSNSSYEGGPQRASTSSRRLSLSLNRDRNAQSNRGVSNRPLYDQSLNLRDPNPPPRLHAIEESGGNSISPESPKKTSPTSRSDEYKPRHGRSVTSLRSSKTVDSETLERLGGHYTVIQRMRSSDSNTSPTDASPEEARSLHVRLVSPGDRRQSTLSSYAADDEDHSGSEDENELVMSPVEITPTDRNPLYSEGLVGPRPPPPPTNSRIKRPTGEVASRIAAYELQGTLSQMTVGGGPRQAPPTDEERKEQREKRMKARSVDWGLTKRPSLFVANPDDRRDSTVDTTDAEHSPLNNT